MLRFAMAIAGWRDLVADGMSVHVTNHMILWIKLYYKNVFIAWCNILCNTMACSAIWDE